MSAIRCDLSVPASFNTVHPSWLWDSKQSQYLLWIQRANICFQSTKFKREVKANMLQVWQSDWNHLTRICFSKNSKKTKQKLVLIHQNAKWGPVSENRESCLGVSIHLHWSYSYELIQTLYWIIQTVSINVAFTPNLRVLKVLRTEFFLLIDIISRLISS